MGQFVQLPGLIDAIKSVINSQMANMAVLPNKVVVPLVPNLDLTRLYFPEPDVSRCNRQSSITKFREWFG